jgi:hypothetical protein
MIHWNIAGRNGCISSPHHVHIFHTLAHILTTKSCVVKRMSGGSPVPEEVCHEHAELHHPTSFDHVRSRNDRQSAIPNVMTTPITTKASPR